MTAKAGKALDSPSRGRRTSRPSGDDRQSAILETAERLLGERGFHCISIDDLARGAGISRSSFYFYFASKEAVLLTLLDKVIAEVNARTDAVPVDFATDPVGSWSRSLGAFINVFAAHKAVTVAVIQVRTSNDEIHRLWEQSMDRWITRTAHIIDVERARVAAVQTVPSRQLSIALNLMNERVLSAAFVNDPPFIPEENVADVLLNIWLSSIYGAADPRG